MPSSYVSRRFHVFSAIRTFFLLRLQFRALEILKDAQGDLFKTCVLVIVRPIFQKFESPKIFVFSLLGRFLGDYNFCPAARPISINEVLKSARGDVFRT